MKLKYFIFFVLVSFIVSCTEEPIKIDNEGLLVPVLRNMLGDKTINKVLDSITGATDAIQILRKGLPGVSMAEVGTWWSGQEYSVANAIYHVGDRTGFITSVACNDNTLTAPNDEVKLYTYAWDWESGPQTGQDIYWVTVINTETIYDTIPMPNGFDNLTFSGNEIDINEGGSINWSSTSDGDVAVYISWVVREEDSTITQYFKYLKVVDDDGSCTISSIELQNAGVHLNSLFVSFILKKWKLKTKNYDSGNKTLWTGAIVDRAISVPVN